MDNPHWRCLRYLSFAVTLGRCTVIPALKAHHNDHLTYRNLGHELPLRDVVPLNRYVHVAVTFLRARGLKTPVNALLRTAYCTWLVAWVFAALVIGHAAGVMHFDVIAAVCRVVRASVYLALSL